MRFVIETVSSMQRSDEVLFPSGIFKHTAEFGYGLVNALFYLDIRILSPK